MADPQPLRRFRVHFHDDTAIDIEAQNSISAEAMAKKQRPGSWVKKIKIVREKIDG